jgi:hypothetical protein
MSLFSSAVTQAISIVMLQKDIDTEQSMIFGSDGL